MKRGCLAFLSATAVVIALLEMPPVPVAGQAPSQGAPEKAGPAPKTAWGEPDLQGIWTNDYDIPLQNGLCSISKSRGSSAVRRPRGAVNEEAKRTSAAPTIRRSSPRTCAPGDGRR